MYYLECLYILVFLSQQSTSVTSLTTKSIWEKLLTDRRNYNYTFQFFANILRNEDAPTCETLHHMGILEKLEDFNERNEHDEKFPLTL
jgi:hypothetical protein